MPSTVPIVYVSNLPYEATHDSIEAAFEKEDVEVERIELIKKGTGTRTKGEIGDTPGKIRLRSWLLGRGKVRV